MISATPTFFDSIKIAGEDYLDGGLRDNNPVSTLASEAADIWPAKPLGCVISIGTGMQALRPFKTNVFTILGSLVSIATETENTAETFQRSHRDLNKTQGYFRFNVDQGA